MKRAYLIALSAAGLASCEERSLPMSAPSFSSAQYADAISAAQTKLTAGAQIILICGASSGVSLLADDVSRGWTKDGMKDGRIIFVDSSEPDVIIRDAMQTYVSAKADGAEVRRISGSGYAPEGSWTISYKSTGVTETHNVVATGGKFIDLWTSNKPIGLPSATVRASASECRVN